MQRYRGATVCQNPVDLVPCSIDIYAGIASKMLQVNRASWTAFGGTELRNRKERAFPRALAAYIDHLRAKTSAPDTLKLASLQGFAIHGLATAGNEWEDLLVRDISSGFRQIQSLRD